MLPGVFNNIYQVWSNVIRMAFGTRSWRNYVPCVRNARGGRIVRISEKRWISFFSYVPAGTTCWCLRKFATAAYKDVTRYPVKIPRKKELFICFEKDKLGSFKILLKIKSILLKVKSFIKSFLKLFFGFFLPRFR